MANTPTSMGSGAATNRSASTTSSPDLAADANALMDEAKTAAGKVAEEAKDQVAGLADRAKEEVSAATDKVRSMAADQKDLLAEQVGGVADAMGRAASDLEQNNGASAQYARMIADNAEKLSDTIRNKNVDELLGMAQSLGGKPGMTGTLTIRYRRPHPLHAEITFEAELVRVEGRKIFTVGRSFADGELRAEAEGLFISVDFSKIAELMARRREAES